MQVMYFWTLDTVPAISGMVPYNVESLKNLYEFSFECVRVVHCMADFPSFPREEVQVKCI